MKKKSPRQKLIKKLDEAVKEVVKQRDGNICQKCGKFVEGSNRQASHVIPVSAGNRLRWEPDNLKILCYHCHLNWWHKNPIESGQWFKDTFPERMAFLEANREIVKWSEAELQEKLDKLTSLAV